MTKILVAEDNPADVYLLREAFQVATDDVELLIVADGEQALEYILRKGQFRDATIPDLVVLDLNLPKIGGLDVLRTIRNDERTRLQPVVILTSSKEDKDLAAGYALGANSYIVKPVDFTQFSDSVRQLGLYWLLINHPPPVAP